MVKAAAVYARISSDQTGLRLGVDRQLADCRALAASLGWPIAEEYVDNDLSASFGKHRPAYEQMMADVAAGWRDAVIVYHVDRLTRRPMELEQFVATVEKAGMRHVSFVTGDVDIGTGDGLMMARMLAIMAAKESADKSRRVRRKLDEIAAKGMPHGGSYRPFGYEADRMTIRPDEADIVRTLVGRYLAGESWRSLCIWLEDNNVRTVTGRPWQTTSLRGTLTSGRIAGLREHRGQVVGPAAWPQIITPEQRDKVIARQAELAVTKRRTPRSYLLSGMLRCGKCDNKLFASRRETSRRYVCLKGPDHGGCGRLTVVADPLERLVTEMVLYRLDTPELADALAGRAAQDEQSAVLAKQIAVDKEKLDELAGMFSANQITSREWLKARAPIQERVLNAERRVSRITRVDALDGWTGNGQQLRAQWADLNLTRQAAIVGAIIDRIVIGPGTSGARGLDPDRVQPVWRL